MNGVRVFLAPFKHKIMGRSTSTAVVPYAMHNVLWTNSPNEKQCILCSPDEVMAGDFYNGDDWDDKFPMDELIHRGWKYNGMIEDGSLYYNEWVKNDMRVRLVNQSQYSSGGDYDMAVIADSEKEINEFVSDMKLNSSTIYKNDTVQQTL